MTIFMKKYLLLFLTFLFCSPSYAATTIVCLMDGKTEELRKSSSSREIKLQQTVSFNDNYVERFDNQFLTDYDFFESHIISQGRIAAKLSLDSEISEDRISLTLANTEKYGLAKNGGLNWFLLSLEINRLTGIGKIEGSISYWTIPYQKDERENEIISYSAYGNCEKKIKNSNE